jgi:hypothetical protein
MLTGLSCWLMGAFLSICSSCNLKESQGLACISVKSSRGDAAVGIDKMHPQDAKGTTHCSHSQNLGHKFLLRLHCIMLKCQNSQEGNSP